MPQKILASALLMLLSNIACAALMNSATMTLPTTVPQTQSGNYVLGQGISTASSSTPVWFGGCTGVTSGCAGCTSGTAWCTIGTTTSTCSQGLTATAVLFITNVYYPSTCTGIIGFTSATNLVTTGGGYTVQAQASVAMAGPSASCSSEPIQAQWMIICS